MPIILRFRTRHHVTSASAPILSFHPHDALNFIVGGLAWFVVEFHFFYMPYPLLIAWSTICHSRTSQGKGDTRNLLTSRFKLNLNWDGVHQPKYSSRALWINNTALTIRDKFSEREILSCLILQSQNRVHDITQFL